MPEFSLTDWNAFLNQHSEAHILQTSEWGELKSAFGWEVVRVVTGNCGAQILFRHLPLGFTLGYIPKGPIGQPTDEFWHEVDRICRSRRAVFLKIELDSWETMECDDSHRRIAKSGDFVLHFSPHSIQPRRTIIVDLRGSEEDILAHMKQKCRYNIRLAEKKDVTIRPWEEVNNFHKMMTVTGARDEFGVHSLEYYRRVYDLFYPSGTCELLAAEYEGRPLAALMAFARGKRAWYMYGASTDEERNRMPAYPLQWKAMCWAKIRGAEEYDLWGVPDEDEETLEANFETRHDGLWGVYRFKRGFGGEVRRAAQAMDRVYQPLLYRTYLWRVSKGAGEQG
jgi:lipid II:glycine glycyltransferase (peptidoglycan interpeptide bridge formation enzyme)